MMPMRAGSDRNGCQQRVEIRRADDVNAAGKLIRRERQRRQGGVAAKTSAHDADAGRVGVTLRHCPGFCVEEISKHGAGPLTIAGVQERLAVAGRTAEVWLEHSIAAV